MSHSDSLEAAAAEMLGTGELNMENLKEGHRLISDEDLLFNIPRRSILKTPNTSNESSSVKPREVSFDSITVRTYGMELGNHPSCQVGAPVTLAWEYEEQEKKDLDIYEFERKPRRRLCNLILNYYRRKDILKRAGYTDKEMKDAERAVAQVQRQRTRTKTFVPVCRLEELVQSAGRKMKRGVGRSRDNSSE
jgi:hypothetical protein